MISILFTEKSNVWQRELKEKVARKDALIPCSVVEPGHLRNAGNVATTIIATN